jgi:hypothetical protein
MAAFQVQPRGVRPQPQQQPRLQQPRLQQPRLQQPRLQQQQQFVTRPPPPPPKNLDGRALGFTRLQDQRIRVNTTPEIQVGAHECIPCDEVDTMYGWGIRVKTVGGESRGQALVRLEASSTWLWWLFLVLAIVYAVTAILLWVFASSAKVSSYAIYNSFFSFTGPPALTPSVLFNFKLRFWHPIGAALAALFYVVIVFRGVERISNGVLNRAIEYGFWWYAFFALLFFQAITILVLNFARFFDLLLISTFAIAGLTFLYMIIIDQVAKYHGPSFVAWIMWIGSLIITLGFSAMLGAYFFNAESQTPGWITALTWILIVWLILGYCLYMLLYMLQVGALKDFRVHLWVLTLLVFVWSMIFYWTLFAKQ